MEACLKQDGFDGTGHHTDMGVPVRGWHTPMPIPYCCSSFEDGSSKRRWRLDIGTTGMPTFVSDARKPGAHQGKDGGHL